MAKINLRQFLEIWWLLNYIIRTPIRCCTNAILIISLDGEDLKAPFFFALSQLLKVGLDFQPLDFRSRWL
jgi:hypothetical protein